MTTQRTQHVHQRIWRRFAVVLMILITALYVWNPMIINDIELNTLDVRQKAFGPQATSGKVAIVAIDEASVHDVGRWPWPRSVLAKMIKHLHEAGAKVIVLDVFFPEPENAKVLSELDAWASQDDAIRAQWEQIRTLLDNDTQLVRAIDDHGKVVLSLVFLPAQEASHISAQANAKAIAQAEKFAIREIRSPSETLPSFYMPSAPAILVNLPRFDEVAAAVGHITLRPDSDGVVRRAQLVLRYQDQFYPSADLYAAALFNDHSKINLGVAEFGITDIGFGEQQFPTDEQGQIVLRYRGPEGSFATFSASQILNKQIPEGALKDKVVLIGATAQGIGDLRNTPWKESFPGVEIRANAVDNLIKGDFITRPDWMAMVDIGIILALGLLLFIVLPRLNMATTGLVVVVLVAVHLIIAFTSFQREQIVLNITYPIVLTVAMFIVHTVVRYFTVEREKGQIKHAFRHYVNPKVVETVIEDVSALKLGGDKREMTVLFSDIRDFTTTSEQVPPEQLVALLNNYLTAMTDKVFDHDGTLDKFIGDAVMAFWGAPVARKDHALQACKAAVTMFEALVDIQKDWAAAGAGKLDIGLGINTGMMTVGNMGSSRMFNFTVIGDAVNLASRIEGLNKLYGTHLLISEGTYQHVKAHFPYTREIDVTRVKGKQQESKIYEIMLPQHYNSFDWLGEYQQVYQAMRKEMWLDAMAGFSKIYDRTGDPVSRYYKELLAKRVKQLS